MPVGYKREVKKGDRFNNLEIIKEVDKKYNKRRFLCRNIKNNQENEVMLCHLTTNQSKGVDMSSDNPNRKHGMKGTRQYNIWQGMKSRCLREKGQQNYKYYGGRGIKVCDRWNKFENFWEDMNSNYADNLTIDRIDVNGDYELSNCRWVPFKDQPYNKRSTRTLTINGITKPLYIWARENNIRIKTLYSRVFTYNIKDPDLLLSPYHLNSRKKGLSKLERNND